MGSIKQLTNDGLYTVDETRKAAGLHPLYSYLCGPTNSHKVPILLESTKIENDKVCEYCDSSWDTHHHESCPGCGATTFKKEKLFVPYQGIDTFWMSAKHQEFGKIGKTKESISELDKEIDKLEELRCLLPFACALLGALVYVVVAIIGN